MDTLGTANPKPHQMPHPVTNKRDMGIQIKTREASPDSGLQNDTVQTMKHSNLNLYPDAINTAAFPSAKN